MYRSAVRHHRPDTGAPISRIALLACLLWLAAAPILATGFADEVWIQAAAWNYDPAIGGLSPSAGFRPDWIPVLTDASAWPTVLGRTQVFSALITAAGLLAIDEPDDLRALACFMKDQGKQVDVNVGGIRLRPKGCDPLTPGSCEPCDLAGEKTSERDFQNLRPWTQTVCDDGASPRLSYLSADHPLIIALQSTGAGGVGPRCDQSTAPTQVTTCDGTVLPLDLFDGTIDFADVAFWASELADYYQDVQGRFHAAYSSGEIPARNDLTFGLWEGAAFFPATAPDGTVYPSNGSNVTIELAAVLDEIICQVAARQVTDPDSGAPVSLELNHFQIDHGPQGVCFDKVGGNACTDSPDGPLDEPEWEFGRVLEVERLARARGLRVGISNHLGPTAKPLDPIAGDQRARDLFVRYAEDYVAAGGNPDYLQAYSWHTHPTLTGPENVPLTYMNIVDEVLTDVYSPIEQTLFLDEDFSSAQTFDQLFDTGGDPCWQVLSIQGSGILEQGCATGTRVAALEDETFSGLRISYITKLLTGSGWSGVHLRKTNAADLPWQSGYLVHLKPQQVGSETQARLTLYRWIDGVGGVSLAVETLDFDPTAQWKRIEVDARGNRLRVYVNGGLEIDVTDIRDDRYTSGFVSLISANRAARIDSLKIERVEPSL